MNNELMKLMTVNFNPTQQEAELNRGGSSHQHLSKLIAELLPLFEKHNIQSMFDAGCNDCRIGIAISPPIIYYGGDISAAMVADSWQKRPHFDIRLHDVTTDPLPKVDLLFVKDVTIHLNNVDKKNIIKNWLSSGIPWLMVTHDEFEDNLDFDYEDGFPFAFVNWETNPWNFPKPIDVVYEVLSSGRCMALWHKDQICQLPE
jgi:hypothetical protein